MNLEKYITQAKEAVNSAYFDFEECLMKKNKEVKKLKSNNKLTKEAVAEENSRIMTEFDNTYNLIVASCKEKIAGIKENFMKEVDDFYRPDGSKIDENDQKLLSSGIKLSILEVCEMAVKHSENPTMLRLIDSYISGSNMNRGNIPENISRAIARARFSGRTEESVFDNFVHIASEGLSHNDGTYTLVQKRLDEYVDEAVVKLTQAKLYLDDEAKEKIASVQEKTMYQFEDGRSVKA